MKYLTLALLFVFSASAALKVGTYNIRNFDRPGNVTNKKMLAEIISETNPDILAIQEIFNADSFTSFLKRNLPDYKVILSKCGGGGGQKLGFIYKAHKLKLLKHIEDARLSSGFVKSCGSLRPAVIGFFKERSGGQKIAALSVHLKAGSGESNYQRRAKQYRKVETIINEIKNEGYERVLALGDFNTTGYDSKNVDYKNFKNFLSSISSSTSAEKVNCTSYWTGEDHNDGVEEASTLDHIVYSKGFDDSISEPIVGSHCRASRCEDVYEDVLGESYQTVSDHCPVSMILK